MADTKTDADDAGGELVFFGATDWAMIGRSDSKKPKAGAPPPQSKSDRAAIYPNLPGPHRIASLQNVAITHVAAGSASCHCVALDFDGRCFTWGRNESGQLGHGDTTERHVPTVVARLAKEKVVSAAAGKFHTVIITAEKTSYSWGGNKHGALGTGSLRKDMELNPVALSVSKPTSVACGSDFTVWLTETPGATIMTAGLPQYGQLGHGTDNEYNAKDSSVKLMYEPQPTPRAISTLAACTINRVACGNNHTVAADTDGHVYTWGFGGHGRLGHKEQKDEFRPRKVDIFTRHNTLPPTGIVAAGAGFCAATAGGGQLYMWGKVKSTGDSWMYPKANQDLSGWHIRHMDCGNTSSAVAADSSTITWGTALYGELGFGESGPKSSAAAKKVDALEGARAIKVACGVGHTVVIVSREGAGEEVIKKLPVFQPHEEEAASGGGGEEGDEGAENEEGEEEDEEEEEEEEEVMAKAGSKRRGGGRGAAAKRGRGAKGKAASAPEEKGAAKRGRGRGRGRGKK